MRDINEFIGKNNVDTVRILINWINDCYRAPETVQTNYAILYGDSGNGKTFLVQLLADLFHLELFRITPFDIESGKDIYDIIKSVNITTLQGKKHRMILVDDFEDFKSSYQKQLLVIKDISHYPVVYTFRSHPTNQEFIKGSLKAPKGRVLKIQKPLTEDLVEYMKKHSSLPIEKIREIAQESNSVRSAMLCLKGSCVNDTLNPWISKGRMLQTIQKRNLTSILDRYDIRMVFRAIQGYDSKALSVKEAFADYDYRLCAKFERVGSISGIDPWLVNHMTEPIEDVDLRLVYRSFNNGKKKKETKPTVAKVKKKETKPEPVKKERKIDNTPSLSKWL